MGYICITLLFLALIVPANKLLDFPAPDGNAHLCEKFGNVYCFTIPGAKS